MRPADLLAAGRAEVTGYGVELLEDRVTAIETGFVVRLASGLTLDTRRILLASGAADSLPDIDGASERWGRDLLHCPYCHGWEVRDRAIGVLGTSPDSVQHALLVRQRSDDVILFPHTLELDAAARLELSARAIGIVHGRVTGLAVEADQLVGVDVADTTIPRSAVFIRPVNVPHADGLLAGLGCETGPDGFAAVDAAGRTSVAGVWAAGNVVDPRLQLISAAGAASVAAISINADLVADDVARAIAGASSGDEPPRSMW
jgi:thioredoxin reductase